MPDRILHRLWCKSCEEWTLHDTEFKDPAFKCEECGTIHEKTLLSDIPKEKILEQRERYKKKKISVTPKIQTKFCMFAPPMELSPEQACLRQPIRKAGLIVHDFDPPVPVRRYMNAVAMPDRVPESLI